MSDAVDLDVILAQLRAIEALTGLFNVEEGESRPE